MTREWEGRCQAHEVLGVEVCPPCAVKETWALKMAAIPLMVA